MSTTANHQATNQQAVSRHSFAKFYKALGSIRYLLSLFEMHSLLRNYVSKVFKFWLKLISSALLVRILVTFVKNSMFIGFSDQKKKLHDQSALNFSLSGRKIRWTMNFTRMWIEFWPKKKQLKRLVGLICESFKSDPNWKSTITIWLRISVGINLAWEKLWEIEDS